jgi:hypothetical protein
MVSTRSKNKGVSDKKERKPSKKKIAFKEETKKKEDVLGKKEKPMKSLIMTQDALLVEPVKKRGRPRLIKNQVVVEVPKLVIAEKSKPVNLLKKRLTRHSLKENNDRIN